jgi:hypothetical protein
VQLLRQQLGESRGADVKSVSLSITTNAAVGGKND